MLTDADVLIDGDALVNSMRYVAEDRTRTVGVGGNVRPLNGCTVRHGHIVDAKLPTGWLERLQMLEYVRSFVGARPGWSSINSLIFLSGAFGIYLRQAVVDVGGLTSGHFGEDLDLSMRIHRHYRRLKKPYRMVYAPSAVVWTEVPSTRKVLRRQRIRWHRGLLTGDLGLPFVPLQSSAWTDRHVRLAGDVLLRVPRADRRIPWLPGGAGVVFLRRHQPQSGALLLLMIAFLAGAFTSLLALFLDERFGYFNKPLEALTLLSLVFVENMGLRQQTVWWRIRAIVGGNSTKQWGDMQRKGVSNLSGKPSLPAAPSTFPLSPPNPKPNAMSGGFRPILHSDSKNLNADPGGNRTK